MYNKVNRGDYMKKKILFSFLLISGFSLTSCGENPAKTKATFDVGIYKTSELKDSTSSDISNALNRKEDFILVLYDKYCLCWSAFRDLVFNEVNSRLNLKTYMIQVDDVTSTYGGLFEGDASSLSNLPLVGIYEKGELFTSLGYSSGDKRFVDYKAFKAWLDDQIEYPVNLFQVNTAQLDELLTSNNSFYVYYTYYRCGDCRRIDDVFLYDYVRKNKLEHPIYVYDTGLEYDFKGERWHELAAVYGLSSVRNKVFGYDVGYAPTIQFIEADGSDYVSKGDISPIIKDMIVTNNDAIYEENGKYYFLRNFFDGTRPLKYSDVNLTNVTIDKDMLLEDSETPRLNGDKAFEVYYKDLVIAFFEYYK